MGSPSGALASHERAAVLLPQPPGRWDDSTCQPALLPTYHFLNYSVTGLSQGPALGKADPVLGVAYLGV